MKKYVNVRRCPNCKKKIEDKFKFCNADCEFDYDKKVDPTNKLWDEEKGWLDQLDDD